MSKPGTSPQKGKQAVNSQRVIDAAQTNDAPAKDANGKEYRWVTGETIIRSTDRSRKDILTYREALLAAESVYFPNRQRLYDLYADIELDGFLIGIRNKLFDTILNKTLLYQKNDTPVDGMAALINSEPFRDMCREILLTKFWGITGLEFIPGPVFKVNSIDRRHVKPKWRKITWEQSGTDGISYDDCWNIWVIGKNKDLGLYLICGFYCLLKKGVISNWAEYIEMFGIPVTVMKYKAYDVQTKAELKKIIKEAGNSLRIVIPEEAQHEIHESHSNGGGQVQNGFRQMANEEMAVLVLGNTETSTSNAKSGGHTQSKTHSDQQKEVIKNLMQYLTNHLNEPKFIEVLQAFGYPVTDGAMFVHDKEVDIDYMSEKYKIDIEWAKAGLPVAISYIYSTYAISKPEPGEALLIIPNNTGPDKSDDPDSSMDDTPSKPQKPKPKDKLRSRHAYLALGGFQRSLLAAFKTFLNND